VSQIKSNQLCELKDWTQCIVLYCYFALGVWIFVVVSARFDLCLRLFEYASDWDPGEVGKYFGGDGSVDLGGGANVGQGGGEVSEAIRRQQSPVPPQTPQVHQICSTRIRHVRHITRPTRQVLPTHSPGATHMRAEECQKGPIDGGKTRVGRKGREEMGERIGGSWVLSLES